MQKVIINLCKKSKIIRFIVRKSLSIIKKIRYCFYKYTTKVDDKLVVFEAYQGRNYACSPKEIYLELLKEEKYNDYKFVWCFRNITKKIDGNAKIVKYHSKKYYKTFAKAKYWIVNSMIDEAITPKKNQIFLQCWHGTPLKRLRHDIKYDGVLNTAKELKKRNDKDTKRFTYLLSPSKFCTKVFTSAFNLQKLHKENIIIEQGYPRNDFLFKYTNDDICRIKDELNIHINKKVILYAPTFRDNQHKSGVGYTYELGIDLDKLYNELKDEYIILFRTHYFVSNSIDLSKYKNFIYDVSNYDDISNLYIISEMLITDYSSVFFDYANLKKPIIFYMYDLDEYQHKLRDFYFDIKELPGPIIDNEKTLIEEIKKYDIKKYQKKYEKFNKKFNYLDNKDSSKKIIDKVFK